MTNPSVESILQRMQSVYKTSLDQTVRRTYEQGLELDQQMAEAGLLNDKRISVTRSLDISSVPHSSVVYFGHDHGFNVQMLCGTIAEVEKDLAIPEREKRVLTMAAYLHDIGRELPWTQDDPECPRRSSEMAGRVLRSRKDGHGDGDFIEAVCRLIATYPEAGTPSQIALRDADILDDLRFDPGTVKSLMHFKARVSQAKTSFVRQKTVHAQWMTYRGW